jgi:hypothetical protein
MQATKALLAAVAVAGLAVVLVAAAKKEDLEDKVQQLVDMSAKRPVIRMNGNKFRFVRWQRLQCTTKVTL